MTKKNGFLGYSNTRNPCYPLTCVVPNFFNNNSVVVPKSFVVPKYVVPKSNA